MSVCFIFFLALLTLWNLTYVCWFTLCISSRKGAPWGEFVLPSPESTSRPRVVPDTRVELSHWFKWIKELLKFNFTTALDHTWEERPPWSFLKAGLRLLFQVEILLSRNILMESKSVHHKSSITVSSVQSHLRTPVSLRIRDKARMYKVLWDLS